MMKLGAAISLSRQTAQRDHAIDRDVATARVDFVDYAKGLCIVLVVMMHSTLGVQDAMGTTSWLNPAIEFARPFRMPDFFLVAGLFLSRTIDAPWRRFFDRKIVHFLYFYLLWTVIQWLYKDVIGSGDPIAESLIDIVVNIVNPTTPVWFIGLLPIFFLVTRALRLGRASWPLVLAAAAALEMGHWREGPTLLSEFAQRFVYFYVGYLFAPFVFAFARGVTRAPLAAMAGLCAWALVNGYAALTPAPHWALSLPGAAGGRVIADLPVVSLALGLAGAGAIVSLAALLARLAATRGFAAIGALGWLGARSLVVFLAFVVPMAAIRVALTRSGLIADVGLMALAVSAFALATPLLLERMVMGTRLAFLFERPDWARLERKRAPR